MNIENELILASEAYTHDIAQRALISNIPFIGSSIDNVFTGKASSYYKSRIETFIEYAYEEFDSIEENKINKDFLETPEFFDLIISLIENSVKTRHVERVKLFSKLLKSKISKDFSSQFEADDFTYIISELIPRDILIIKEIEKINSDFIYEKQASEKTENIYDLITVKCFQERTNLSNSEIIFSLSKLAKLGLLNEYYAGNVFGMDPGGDYKSTDTFEVLINILNI
ncbi:hypothetical protein H0I29_16750 [Polaribacter sp. R2A056_3_33]|jgi:hypothetical protein|uniref:Abi-alpha family protein n=1 Tax=Polaribacter sp. R2A056_3_33 TaxID=2745563 RepID=UPI001C4E9E5E|nr:hypothetical protein [Polaribacter sp. R2A056_3_33]QXP70243.1 hypothetical protein H0I29_16750 [Polaribacter sp. R2A056_3_33]